MRRACAVGLAVAVAVAASPGRPTRAAALRRAAPVRLVATPRSQFELCTKNALLRPICPKRLPTWGAARGGRTLLACIDRAGRQAVGRRRIINWFTHDRCAFADWGYESGTGVPGLVAGGPPLSGWDGSGWIPLASESGLFAPPFHVHVEVAAAVGSAGAMAPAGGWPTRTHRLTDRLLAPGRARAVSLGWVHWSGRRAQLVLEPAYPAGGEWGGHLVWHAPPNARGVRYAVSLHAWMPALRIGSDVLRAQPGPALPHVIATLERIVASTRLGS